MGFIYSTKARVFLLLIVSFSRLLASPQEIPDLPDEVKQKICSYTFSKNYEWDTPRAEQVRWVLLSDRQWTEAMMHGRADQWIRADLDEKSNKKGLKLWSYKLRLDKQRLELYIAKAKAANAKIQLSLIGSNADNFEILDLCQHLLTALDVGFYGNHDDGFIKRLFNYFKKTSTEGIDLLMQMPYLQDLTLYKVQLKDQDIGRGLFGPSWVGSPLRRIKLINCDLSNKGLIRFTELSNLESLTLQECPNITQVDALKTARALRYLSVFRSPVPIELAHAFKKARPEVDVVGRAGSYLSFFPLGDLPLDVFYSIGEFLQSRDLQALMCVKKGLPETLRPIRTRIWYYCYENLNQESLKIEPQESFFHQNWRKKKAMYEGFVAYMQAAGKQGKKVALRMLRLYMPAPNDSFWPFIEFISCLDLSKASIDPGVIHGLTKAKNLRVLILDEVSCATSRDLTEFGYFPFDVSPLAEMQSLEELSLAECGYIKANSLASLAKAPRLKKLTLKQLRPSIDKRGSAHRDFAPRNAGDDIRNALTEMQTSASLTSLDLRGNNLEPDDINDVLSIPSLQELFTDVSLPVRHISSTREQGSRDAPVIIEFPGSSSLTALNLETPWFWPSSAQVTLNAWFALRTLNLSMFYFNNFDFASLSKFKSLESLRINITEAGQPSKSSKMLLENLARIRSLKKLTLIPGISRSDASNFDTLAPLADLPELQELSIYWCFYTKDLNFDVFLNMPALQRLHIPSTTLFENGGKNNIIRSALTQFQVKRPKVMVYMDGKLISF